MKISFILIVFFTFTNISLSQQENKRIELNHLNIINNDFPLILDSLVLHEKKCNYYDSTLIFSINIQKNKNYYLITLSSLKDTNIVLDLTPYGYFYSKAHIFFVMGDESSGLFTNKGDKKIFRYIDYALLNNRRVKKKSTIYFFNDDSFTMWSYWYVNKKFVLESKSSSCQ